MSRKEVMSLKIIMFTWVLFVWHRNGEQPLWGHQHFCLERSLKLILTDSARRRHWEKHPAHRRSQSFVPVIKRLTERWLSGYQHWLFFQKTRVQFPALTQQLRAFSKSCPRESNTSWPLKVPGKQMVHKLTWSKTPIHKRRKKVNHLILEESDTLWLCLAESDMLV